MKKNTKKLVHKNFFILVIVSVFFLIFSISSLKYEILQPDEAFVSVFPIQVLKGYQPDMRVDTEAWILNVIPTNYHEYYAFQLISFFLFPSFIILGVNIFALKLTGVLAGFFLLLIFYFLIKEIFGQRPAIFVVMFLSTSPNYIYFSKSAIQSMEFFICLILSLALLLYFLYIKKKQPVYAYLSAFCVGLSLSIKLSATALLISMLMSGLIFYRRELLIIIKKIRYIELLLILMFFSLGASLFIYYNVSTGGKTFTVLNYFHKEYSPSDSSSNGNYLENMKKRVRLFNAFVSTKIYPWAANMSVLFIVFLVSVPLNILFILKKRNKKLLKKILSVYLGYLILFFVSGLTPADVTFLQMPLFYPFPFLSVALLLNFMISDFKITANKKRVFCVVVGGLLLYNNLSAAYWGHFSYKRKIERLKVYEKLVEYVESEKVDVCIVAYEYLAGILRFGLVGKGVGVKWVHNKNDIEEFFSQPGFSKAKICFINGGDAMPYQYNNVQWFVDFLRNIKGEIVKTEDFHDNRPRLHYRVYHLDAQD